MILEDYIQHLNDSKASVHAEFAARSSPLELDDDHVVKQYRDDFRVGLLVLQHQDDVDVDGKPVPQPDKEICLLIPTQDLEGSWCVWQRKELPPAAVA